MSIDSTMSQLDYSQRTTDVQYVSLQAIKAVVSVLRMESLALRETPSYFPYRRALIYASRKTQIRTKNRVHAGK